MKSVCIHSPERLPPIDAVLISHMHLDHLSYGSLELIAAKTRALFVPAGGLVYIPEAAGLAPAGRAVTCNSGPRTPEPGTLRTMPDRPRPRPPRPERPESGRTARERELAAQAELIEVERALAALEGRNVANAEHLVAQRAETEKRRADLEGVIATSRAEIARRKKLLPIQIAAAAAAVAGLVAVAGPVSRALQGHLDDRERLVAQAGAAAKPFERRLSLMRTELGAAPFTFSAAEGRCFVVLAASADAAASAASATAASLRIRPDNQAGADPTPAPACASSAAPRCARPGRSAGAAARARRSA